MTGVQIPRTHVTCQMGMMAHGQFQAGAKDSQSKLASETSPNSKLWACLRVSTLTNTEYCRRLSMVPEINTRAYTHMPTHPPNTHIDTVGWRGDELKIEEHSLVSKELALEA